MIELQKLYVPMDIETVTVKAFVEICLYKRWIAKTLSFVFKERSETRIHKKLISRTKKTRGKIVVISFYLESVLAV